MKATKSGKKLMLSLAAFILVLSGAWAEEVAKIKFQTPAANGSKATVSFDKYKEGASGKLTLQGDGSKVTEIRNDATGFGKAWPEFLQKGFLRVAAYANTKDVSQVGLLSSGEKKNLGAYLKKGKSKGYLSGTMHFVVKPTSDWNKGRHALMGVGHSGSEGYMSLELKNGTLMLDCNNKGGDARAQCTLKQEWQKGQWYYIAASWEGGKPPVLYVQQLDPSDPKNSPKGNKGTVPVAERLNPVVPKSGGRWGFPFCAKKKPFSIGAKFYDPGANAGNIDGAGADIAYFCLENEYANADELATTVSSSSFRPTRKNK